MQRINWTISGACAAASMTVLKLIRSSRQDKWECEMRDCEINERYTQGITSHTIDNMMMFLSWKRLENSILINLPKFCQMLPSVWWEKVTHSGQVGQGIFQVPWLGISLDHLSIGLCIGPNSLGTHLTMPLCCFLTQSTIGICLATKARPLKGARNLVFFVINGWRMRRQGVKVYVKQPRNPKDPKWPEIEKGSKSRSKGSKIKAPKAKKGSKIQPPKAKGSILCRVCFYAAQTPNEMELYKTKHSL